MNATSALPTERALSLALVTATVLALMFGVTALALYLGAWLSPGFTRSPMIGAGATGQALAAAGTWLLRRQIKKAQSWHRREQAATQGRRA